MFVKIDNEKVINFEIYEREIILTTENGIFIYDKEEEVLKYENENQK